jgi:hypothetical protein
MSSNEAGAKIESMILALGDWRGETLAKVRDLILRADPEIQESLKWQKPSNPDGVPVWEHHGIICTGEVYKDKVKLTFAKGAQVPDPTGIFNSSLDGNARRAIDIKEGSFPDEHAFTKLIQEAIAVNVRSKK